MVFERLRFPLESDIANIERVTGLKLSNEFKILYANYSGYVAAGMEAEIEFTFPNGNESFESIQTFVTVDDIREQWPHIGYVVDFCNHFGLDDTFIEPQYLIPVANTYDGVIYVATGGKHIDKVYFTDNGDFGIALLATSSNEFAEMISELPA